MVKKKTYYEKRLEEYEKLSRVENRKDFFDSCIDLSKKIQKDSDAKIVAALIKERELIGLGLLKNKEEKPEKLSVDEARIKIGELFEDIKFILKRYVKLKEE